jgi:hypothetical protein
MTRLLSVVFSSQVSKLVFCEGQKKLLPYRSVLKSHVSGNCVHAAPWVAENAPMLVFLSYSVVKCHSMHTPWFRGRKL